MQIKPLLEINLLQYGPSYLKFLKQVSQRLDGFTIINKSSFDQPQEVIQELLSKFPEHRLIPHVSIKQNYRGSRSATLEFLSDHLQSHSRNNLKEILLLSGMPKRSLDTVDLLVCQEAFDGLEIGVAYNPFLKDSQQKQLEQDRLENKLQYEFVKTVYLQLGEDITAYNQAINLIRNLRPDAHIVAAVLNPLATKVIASIKFRPWNGVYYSQAYLSDLDFRIGATTRIFNLLETYKVQVLLEFYSKIEDIIVTTG
jgi:5,10-methylenetetrahydrofolate reductase